MNHEDYEVVSDLISGVGGCLRDAKGEEFCFQAMREVKNCRCSYRESLG